MHVLYVRITWYINGYQNTEFYFGVIPGEEVRAIVYQLIKLSDWTCSSFYPALKPGLMSIFKSIMSDVGCPIRQPSSSPPGSMPSKSITKHQDPTLFTLICDQNQTRVRNKHLNWPDPTLVGTNKTRVDSVNLNYFCIDFPSILHKIWWFDSR